MRPFLNSFGRLALIIAVLLCISSVALAQIQTIRFDELSPQPLNGVTFEGVTFTFTVGGVGSTDATFGGGGPGQITFVQDPSAEGDANGTLTIAFSQPTPSLSFGLARNADAAQANVQLFDQGGAVVQTTVVNLAVITTFAEALFTYSGAIPIRRAVVTFLAPLGPGARFALDNLRYEAGPLAGPGAAFPATSQVSDQKAGSILFFNVYTSSLANPGVNTRFNVTNTNEDSGSFLHLFFVEGSTCSVADRYICLTANQTMSFLASEQDPATTGYVIAIAVSSTGCPINFNYLIGDEYVKLETGEFANLGAEAISAITAEPAGCAPTAVTATILFDGVSYNRVPRVLAFSNIPSRGDGASTRIIVNRVGGNLSTTAGSIGQIFGILYDDSEQPHSFTIPFSGCQRQGILSDAFPRTSPRFDVVIPAGQTGWMRFWSTSDVGILGAGIVTNPNTSTVAGSYNSGHNLHKLKLTTDAYVMPIFSPGC